MVKHAPLVHPTKGGRKSPAKLRPTVEAKFAVEIPGVDKPGERLAALRSLIGPEPDPFLGYVIRTNGIAQVPTNSVFFVPLTKTLVIGRPPAGTVYLTLVEHMNVLERLQNGIDARAAQVRQTIRKRQQAQRTERNTRLAPETRDFLRGRTDDAVPAPRPNNRPPMPRAQTAPTVTQATQTVVVPRPEELPTVALKHAASNEASRIERDRLAALHPPKTERPGKKTRRAPEVVPAEGKRNRRR